MKRIKYIILSVILILVLANCIDYFHPNLGGKPVTKYVVDGLITDQEGYHTVYVSTTSSLDMPNYRPLSNCDVKILDSHGNQFQLKEFKFGQYRVFIGKENLQTGNSYRVKVVTPEGVEIISDFDQMPACPEIDSVYYQRKDYPTTDPNKTIQAIQFYIDINRGTTNSHYYRWEIDETWEHHAAFPITLYLDQDGKMQNAFPPDYSRFTCYTTERVKEIFTLTTENINPNIYLLKPLHIVDNQTQRLTFCYSILVYQYALSKQAFEYWDKLRTNTTEQGGLYNAQPLRIKGNLRSISSPELEVLGYFSASASTKPKRIIVRNVEDFEVCEPYCIDPTIPIRTDYKYIYFINIEGKIYGLYNDCIECDYISGTVNKPDFWPY